MVNLCSSARMSLTIECLLSRATFLSRANKKRHYFAFVHFLHRNCHRRRRRGRYVKVVTVCCREWKKRAYFEYFRAFSVARAAKETENAIKRSCTRGESERLRPTWLTNMNFIVPSLFVRFFPRFRSRFPRAVPAQATTQSEKCGHK